MVNTVGKGCSEVDRAYLAGFLDADGAIMAIIEKHQEKKFDFRIRIIVKITQSKKDLLEWFCEKFNLGRINRNRTTYDWLIRDQQAVYKLLDLLAPYLKVKKKQAELAQIILKEIKNCGSCNEMIAIARKADALANLNIRSKNRRKNYSQAVKEHFSRND